MDREFYVLQNPNGSLLLFILNLEIEDEHLKKEKIIWWLNNQSPSHDKLIHDAYEALKEEFECSIEFLDKLFVKIGWMTHYILPIFKEKLLVMTRCGLIDNQGDVYRITDLGKELFNNNKYKHYFDSYSIKADYWKDRNVKFYHENEIGIGSGFFIDYNKIATCKHVYEDLKDNLKIEDESGKSYSINKVWYHENKKVDIVVIITNESFEKIPLYLGHEINLVEKVLVFGYPPVPLTSKSYLICNLGEISGKVDNFLEQVDYLLLSCIVKPGNSGGPVIDEYGKVVGIATQNIMERVTIEKNEPIDWIKSVGYSSALPVKYLKELITCPNII